jgi:hypothetical protein
MRAWRLRKETSLDLRRETQPLEINIMVFTRTWSRYANATIYQRYCQRGGISALRSSLKDSQSFREAGLFLVICQSERSDRSRSASRAISARRARKDNHKLTLPKAENDNSCSRVYAWLRCGCNGPLQKDEVSILCQQLPIPHHVQHFAIQWTQHGCLRSMRSHHEL